MPYKTELKNPIALSLATIIGVSVFNLKGDSANLTEPK